MAIVSNSVYYVLLPFFHFSDIFTTADSLKKCQPCLKFCLIGKIKQSLLVQLCCLVKKGHCDASKAVVLSTSGQRFKKFPPITRGVKTVK